MTRSLVLLESLADLRAFEERTGSVTDRHLLVVGDNAVAASLERRGVPFAEATAFLDSATAEAHLTAAPQIAAAWSKRCRLAGAQAGLGELPEFAGDLYWPIEICLNAAHVWDRILDENSVNELVLIGAEPTAMVRNGPAPAFIPASSLAHAVARSIAAKRRITVQAIPDASPRRTHARPWRPRVAVAERYRGRDSFRPSRSRASDPVAIIWREGIWPQEIAETKAVLRGESGWSVLDLARADLDLFSPLLRRGKLTRQEFAGQLAAILREHAPAAPRHPELFASPHLAFQLIATATEVHRAVELQTVFEAIVSRARPSALVLGHDAFTVERALEEAGSRHDVPTVSLAHSGLMPLSGYVGLLGGADTTCIWNSGDRERLEAASYSERRFDEIGSLRFDARFRDVRVRDEGRAGDTATDHGRRRIVILTSPTGVGLSFPTADAPAYREAWAEIVRLARAHAEWEFLIRPHPAYDQIEYYEQIVRASGGAIRISSGGSIEDALGNADLAVLMNYCSTAAFDALLLDVPLVFVTSALRESRWVMDPLRSAGVTEVRDVAAMETILSDSLSSPEKVSSLLQWGRSSLARIVGDSGTPSRVRFQRLLDEVTQDRGRRSRTIPVGNRDTPAADVRPEISEVPPGPLRSAMDLSIEASIATAVLVATNPAPPGVTRESIAVLEAELGSSGMAAAARRRIVLAAYLLGMRKRLEEKRWEDAARLSLEALLHRPEIMVSADYWMVASKCLVMRLTLTHRIANRVDMWVDALRRRFPRSRTSRLGHSLVPPFARRSSPP